jgi:hypothetical protein
MVVVVANLIALIVLSPTGICMELERIVKSGVGLGH